MDDNDPATGYHLMDESDRVTSNSSAGRVEIANVIMITKNYVEILQILWVATLQLLFL